MRVPAEAAEPQGGFFLKVRQQPDGQWKANSPQHPQLGEATAKSASGAGSEMARRLREFVGNGMKLPKFPNASRLK